jgi:uncharacterized protein (TIGR02246 family)
MADQAGDEAAIWKVVEQMFSAFAKGDPAGMAAHFDKVYENATGARKGARAFVEYYKEWLKDRPNFKSKIIEKIGVVFVTSDVAIAKARVEYSGLIDADGKPLSPGKALQAEVFVRRNGRWLRAAAFIEEE